jgi:hypothetical protein
MRHFYRSSLVPADVVAAADEFFTALGMAASNGAHGARTRALVGPLGNMTLSVRSEGGHYTFVDVETDQIGESRLDKNVKKFFVALHRQSDPSHKLKAGY